MTESSIRDTGMTSGQDTLFSLGVNFVLRSYSKTMPKDKANGKNVAEVTKILHCRNTDVVMRYRFDILSKHH